MLRRSAGLAGRLARQLSAAAAEGGIAVAESTNRPTCSFAMLHLFESRGQQGSTPTWQPQLSLRHFSSSNSWSDDAGSAAASASAPLPDLSQVLDPTTIVKAASLAEPAAIAEASVDLWAPTQGIQQLLVAVHGATGLDWWQSIMLTTFGVRLVTFPVMLYQIRNTYKLSQARPEMEKLVEWMKEEQARGNTNVVGEYQQRVAAVWAKYDAHPMKSVSSILVQLPIFVGFFSSLRAFAAVKVPSLVEGGALWFTDLTVPDPTYMLPILSSLAFLLTVELGAADGMEGQPEQTRRRMKNFMRFLAVGFVPLTVNMPAGVFCYWAASNVFTLIQSLVLKIPAVKKVLGLPDLKTAHLAQDAKLVGKQVVTYAHPPPSARAGSRAAKAAASAARVEQALDRAAAKSR